MKGKTHGDWQLKQEKTQRIRGNVMFEVIIKGE